MSEALIIVALAFAVGAFMRLAKAPVPRRWRPMLAGVTGTAFSTASVLAQAVPWESLLTRAGLSTAVAIAGHLVIVEWLRGGREIGARDDR